MLSVKTALRTALVSLAFALSAAPAHAIPFVPPPIPIYEAPIDRALANIAGNSTIDQAQRENLMGRLNLLAYMRDDARFAYTRESNELHEAGAISCLEAQRQRPNYGRGAQPNEPQQTFTAEDLCARITFELGPYPQIEGTPPENPSAGARARLLAARGHFTSAIRLDPDNLRARLGLAYVLDRMGQRTKARAQLRALLERGLPQLAGETSDWETHAVLTETAAHLGQLATNGRERRDMERLRARLQASRPMIYMTPVVVPLRDAPFAALVNHASDVAFDFAGTGDRAARGWLTDDAAWLVWDPHARGHVRSGLDMIGARTWAAFWRDGFEVLRALDDDRSGDLTGAELGGLALWRDVNANGVSEPGEVRPVAAYNIAALATRGDQTNPRLITAPGGVRFNDGTTRALYDWTPDGGEHERATAAPVS